MKKINLILIIVNIVLVVLICVKLAHQTKNYEYILADTDASTEELRYELEREIQFGEGKYSEYKNGLRKNISEEVVKEKVLNDGLKVTDINMFYNGVSTNFVAKVKNNTTESKGGYYSNLVFYNDQNEKICSLKVYFDKIEPGEEKVIVSGINTDISDMYKCEIEEVEADE